LTEGSPEGNCLALFSLSHWGTQSGLQLTVPGIVEKEPGQSGGQGPIESPLEFNPKTKIKIRRFPIAIITFDIYSSFIKTS
jgi:hypothetical protein